MAKKSNRRSEKRAKFVKTEPKGRTQPPWYVIAALAVVALGLGLWSILSVMPKNPSGAAETIAQTELLPAPAAATHGHDPYTQVVPVNGEVRLLASAFSDGQAHHLTYMAGDAPIEFFVLKSADGALRTAYNACDVCYSSKRGYAQDGDDMVCLNCGRRFPSDQVGLVEGGCNPAPLEHSLEGDVLVLEEADILLGARFFLGDTR